MFFRLCLPSLLVLTAASLPARAAESYDNCTGFIDTVPAVVGTQGVWCLRAHQVAPITTGAAITVNTNNVTIDCNGFRLSNLPADPPSTLRGILAINRRNVTVRNCNVQGFHIGIHLSGSNSGGALVEDNLLDGNLYTGISVNGSDNLIRRNHVISTGGAPNSEGNTYGIDARADLEDNTIDHVFTTTGVLDPVQFPVGIRMLGHGTEARGNQLRMQADNQPEIHILVGGNHVTVAGNTMYSRHSSGAVAAAGIQGNGASNTFCSGNVAPATNPEVTDCQDFD